MLKRYRVNGSDDYTIDYRAQADGTYKMFAVDHPSNPCGGCVSDHHLYSSGEICVSAGNEPRSLDRAKAIAVRWMEGYSKYIRTGEFPNGPARVNV
jgi:hypothetical protein